MQSIGGFASSLTALESLRYMHGGYVDGAIDVAACKQLRELVITGKDDNGLQQYLTDTLLEIQAGGGLPQLTRLECIGGDVPEDDVENPIIGPCLAASTALAVLRLPACHLMQHEVEAVAAALPALQDLAALAFDAPHDCDAAFPKLARLSCRIQSDWELPVARLAPALTHFHARYYKEGIRRDLFAGHARLDTLAFDVADLPGFVSSFLEISRAVPVRHLSVLGSIDATSSRVLAAFRALCRVTRDMPSYSEIGLSFCSRRDADEVVAIAAADAAPTLKRLEVAFAQLPSGDHEMRRMLFAIKSFQSLKQLKLQEGYDDGSGGWVRGCACMRPADLEILCDPKGWKRPPVITLAGVRGVRRADVQRQRAAAGGRGPSVVLEPGPEWVL